MIAPARIHIRFSDLDVLGHVNNSIYLSYFEIARIHYFGILLGTDWDWKVSGVVLAKNEVEYIRPVLLHDEAYVHLFTEEIGTKSFKVNYELKVNGTIYTKGSSTLVCFDSTKNETIPIPSLMLNALQKLKKEQ